MKPANFDRLRRLREECHALHDADAATRAARLAALEHEDAELAANLRRLLPLVDAERDLIASAAKPDARIGSVIGLRYRLQRIISIGGMGEVYLAERIDEVHKQVALKLMRADVPVTIERARREQQILARLVHPHIAGLIDAGLDDGRPWFAMDYIDGKHIDVWCDHRRLDLRARVTLFARVCSAVQFAHKNLVLHCDLKPSNILVEADGAPALLDFGIARLLGADTPGTTQTLALTPAYAAPEQLRGEPATTASDVYQLGLVLYKLATGLTARQARNGGPALPRVDQAVAALIPREPARAQRIAAARGSRPQRLRRTLKGDLARIVAKATAQDMQERYDTAQALAEDLRRWSEGRPVAAHRGSFGYRAAKLIRRNAIAVAAITVLVLGLLASSVIAVDRAQSERVQRMQAELQRQRSANLLAFMREAFRENDPNLTHGDKLGAVDLLNRAREKLDQRQDLDTPTRAALQTQIADVLLDLGQVDAALPSAQAAVTALAPVSQQHAADYLMSVGVLADTLQSLGRYQAVLDLIGPALPLAGKTIGGEHRWLPLLLDYRGRSFMRLEQIDRAQADLDAALTEFAEAGDRSSDDFLRTLNDLGSLANYRGNHRQALGLYRRTLRIASGQTFVRQTDGMAVQANIALTLNLLGDTRAAIDMLEPVVRQYDALNICAAPTVAGSTAARWCRCRRHVCA